MSTDLALTDPPVTTLLLDLQKSGAITSNALILTDPQMPYEKAQALCRYFGTVRDASQWWIADLLIYMEKVLPEEFSQLSEELNVSPATRSRWMRVSERIPHEQRNPELSWSHHFVVSHLGRDERNDLLNEAARKGWSKAQLETEVREGEEPLPEPPMCRCDHCGNEHRVTTHS